jgi:ElaB/YqjD/DUF883 family membrane-anchored ribosome-binding protein
MERNENPERADMNGHGGGSALTHIHEAQLQAAEQMERIRDALISFDESARAFIRKRPGLCLVGAIAAGFLIGRLVSRR